MGRARRQAGGAAGREASTGIIAPSADEVEGRVSARQYARRHARMGPINEVEAGRDVVSTPGIIARQCGVPIVGPCGLWLPESRMRGLLYEKIMSAKAALRGRHTFRLLATLRESERWPVDQLDRFRAEKLQRLVNHAYDQVPAYRALMGERGVRPADIRGLADIQRLPVMTKDRLRADPVGYRARDIPDHKVTIGRTGGTTGSPMRIPRDWQTGDWGSACYMRGLAWGGLTLRDKRVRLFGGSLGVEKTRPLDGVRHWLAGEVFLPAFELSPDTVDAYVDRIRRSGARYLIGYASACSLLASLVEQHGLSLTFDAVFPTAELLLAEWGDTIARVFQGKVLPYYGCGELNSLGYACPESSIGTTVYHTCDEHAIIEIESTSGETGLEGEGAFLITDLDNFATPILRYRNGDAGHIAPAGCACGRSLGRILRLDGRINDVLVTTTGSRFSGVIATHAFRHVENVETYQIVQRSPGQVLVRIVRGRGYDPAIEEPKVKRIFGEHLGVGFRVDIAYVSDIERTPAGKARFVVNEYLASVTESPMQEPPHD